ncbi:unnamed protein product [Rotaria sp. Silwood1]|nr:unnamed protein product [Rotaria sp. Silwood1]
MVQNKYFSYNDKYYHQVCGSAMGSPLTLIIANCYMFFFEQDIVKQINNSNGLCLRYIDDIYVLRSMRKILVMKFKFTLNCNELELKMYNV